MAAIIKRAPSKQELTEAKEKLLNTPQGLIKKLIGFLVVEFLWEFLALWNPVGPSKVGLGSQISKTQFLIKNL